MFSQYCGQITAFVVNLKVSYHGVDVEVNHLKVVKFQGFCKYN